MRWHRELMVFMHEAQRDGEHRPHRPSAVGNSHALDMLDLPESRRWLERAYAATQEARDGWLHAFVAFNLADTLWECGERGKARHLAEASLRQFEALGDEHYVPDPRLLLARAQGDATLAAALAAEALAQRRRVKRSLTPRELARYAAQGVH